MKLLSLIISLGLVISANWLTDFEKAKEQAKENHHLILLNFSGSDWCAPCIKMKQEVFQNETFLSIADKKLVLIRADFPRSKKNQLSKEQKAHNEALAEKYNPLGKFPYTLLLDKNGKILREWDGYEFSSQDKFIAALEKELK